MGKHEPMSAKAIANKIKAKGLQKISFYCQMCEKQCRDANGFKCHIQSEAHQRQALIVSENPERFVSEFSKQFMDGFMYLLRVRYRHKKILANTVFQEYIKERDHVHMNGTRWTTLTEFANWLGENGYVEVEESERGVMVTYIDKDPEAIRRRELAALREQRAKEAAERNQKEIEEQMESARKILRDHQKEAQEPEPIPMVRVPADAPTTIDISEDQSNQSSSRHDLNNEETIKDQQPSTSEAVVSEQAKFVERPVFKVGTISLKAKTNSAYKPPPPKKRVVVRKIDSSSTKKTKTS